MDRLLFRKIELWVLLLLGIVGFAALIFFGSVVRNAALGNQRFGTLGASALALAEIPANARKLLQDDESMVAFRSVAVEGKRGWQFDPAAQAFPGYVLLSRYDGDAGRHIIELVDIANGSVAHTWRPDADRLLAGTTHQSTVVTFERWRTRYFRFIHPLLLPDGGLVLKDHQSPLIRTDACGEMVWRREGSFFHHTTEPAADGSLWVPGRIEPSVIEGAPPSFRDETIAHVSPEGVIIDERSVAKILVDNGLAWQLFATGRYQDDLIHLNDVQPVPGDGPYWQKGDLFLSLRHLSMIALYRPATNEIVWSKQGPWVAQHDVDVVDDHTIAVFSNNAFRFSTSGRGKVDGTNQIVFYDFAQDRVSRPFAPLFAAQRIATVSEGLFEILPGGYLMVEEENSARFLVFAPDGTLAAEFVNRAADGKTYRLGWSRFVSRDLGESAMAALANQTCAN